MADSAMRLKENQSGNFFVDSSCVGCLVCVMQNPQFFKIIEPKLDLAGLAEGSVIEISAAEAESIYGKAIVYNQPATETDLNEVRETMSICPTASIGEMEK